jgi:hypothetical protein
VAKNKTKQKEKKKKNACMEAQYLNISQSMLKEILDKWNFLTVFFRSVHRSG